MTKEEILEKSREENKKKDPFEAEILNLGNRYACISAGILATIFFVAQILIGGGLNYGLYAVLFSMPMAGFWVRYAKTKRRRELLLALCYSVMVLMLAAAHLYNLISSSTIV